MPLGKVSSEEFEAELHKLRNPGPTVIIPSIPPQIIDISSPGRKEGDVNTPESIRKLIGATAVEEGRAAAIDLGKMFGLSKSSVSAYANGATSTASYQTGPKSLIDHIAKARKRAVTRASNTLNMALGSISQEKLDYADAKDLSAIAKDMSVVIKNLEPPPVAGGSQTSAPQFVVYAPTFRQENSYQTIESVDE